MHPIRACGLDAMCPSKWEWCSMYALVRGHWWCPFHVCINAIRMTMRLTNGISTFFLLNPLRRMRCRTRNLIYSECAIPLGSGALGGILLLCWFDHFLSCWVTCRASHDWWCAPFMCISHRFKYSSDHNYCNSIRLLRECGCDTTPIVL